MDRLDYLEDRVLELSGEVDGLIIHLTAIMNMVDSYEPTLNAYGSVREARNYLELAIKRKTYRENCNNG